MPVDINEKVLSAHDMHNYAWYGTQDSNEISIKIPGLNDPNVAWFWVQVHSNLSFDGGFPLRNRLDWGMLIDPHELDVKMIDLKCQPITKLAMRYGWYVGPSCQGHFPDYDSLKSQWETMMQVRVDLCKKQSTIMKNAANYITYEDSYASKRRSLEIKSFRENRKRHAVLQATYNRYYDSYHEYATDVISLNGIGSALFGFGPQVFAVFKDKGHTIDMPQPPNDYTRKEPWLWSKMLDRNLVEVEINLRDYTVQFKITSSTTEENDEAWTLALLEMKKINHWAETGETKS